MPATGLATVTGGRSTLVVSYTITGLETNAGLDFRVPIGQVLAANTYGIGYAPAGVANMPALDLPNGVGDRTTIDFRVLLAAALTVGDVIAFFLYV